MNEDCENLSCPVPNNSIQAYLNQYSLQAIIVSNAEYSAVINGVPVTIPAGTFNYSLTNDIVFSSLTYQGCNSVISIPVPPGSTAAQIQALVQQMLNQAAQQQAQCDAAASGNLPPPHFVNQLVTVASTCTTPPLVIMGSLPVGITQSGNDLICAAGIFASNVSQADANQKATNFLNNLLATLFASGNASCTDCPSAGEFDGEITNSSPANPCIGGYKADLYPISVPGGKNVQIVMTSSDFTPYMSTSGGLPDSKNQCSYGHHGSDANIIDADASIVLNASTLNPGDRGNYHLVITCVDCVDGVGSIADLTWAINAGSSAPGWQAIGSGATPGMNYVGANPATSVRMDSVPLKVLTAHNITVAITANANIANVSVSAGASFFYNKQSNPPLTTAFTLVKGCYILSLYASTANVGGSVSAVIS